MGSVVEMSKSQHIEIKMNKNSVEIIHIQNHLLGQSESRHEGKEEHRHPSLRGYVWRIFSGLKKILTF